MLQNKYGNCNGYIFSSALRHEVQWKGRTAIGRLWPRQNCLERRTKILACPVCTTHLVIENLLFIYFLT